MIIRNCWNNNYVAWLISPCPFSKDDYGILSWGWNIQQHNVAGILTKKATDCDNREKWYKCEPILDRLQQTWDDINCVV